jgi:hypothetical protein
MDDLPGFDRGDVLSFPFDLMSWWIVEVQIDTLASLTATPLAWLFLTSTDEYDRTDDLKTLYLTDVIQGSVSPTFDC